jgi:hypothetical protein
MAIAWLSVCAARLSADEAPLLQLRTAQGDEAVSEPRTWHAEGSHEPTFRVAKPKPTSPTAGPLAWRPISAKRGATISLPQPTEAVRVETETIEVESTNPDGSATETFESESSLEITEPAVDEPLQPGPLADGMSPNWTAEEIVPEHAEAAQQTAEPGSYSGAVAPEYQYSMPHHDVGPGEMMHRLKHWAATRFDSPANRHRGLGHPLMRESWRYRPWGFSWFAGMLIGDELLPNRMDMDAGVFGGVRISWDRNYYWAYEARMAYGEIDTEPEPRDRNVTMFYLDANVLYYPWGDARWRPYGLLGFGIANLRFFDELNLEKDDAALAMPFGVGLKYRYNGYWAFRFDITDNLVFGSKELPTMNNISFTAGTEIRFGGKRRSYWPWNPQRILR